MQDGLQPSEDHAGYGAEYKAEKAPTKDGAGGGADVAVELRYAGAQDRGGDDSFELVVDARFKFVHPCAPD
jgi:hypothetical protein